MSANNKVENDAHEEKTINRYNLTKGGKQTYSNCLDFASGERITAPVVICNKIVSIQSPIVTLDKIIIELNANLKDEFKLGWKIEANDGTSNMAIGVCLNIKESGNEIHFFKPNYRTAMLNIWVVTGDKKTIEGWGVAGELDASNGYIGRCIVTPGIDEGLSSVSQYSAVEKKDIIYNILGYCAVIKK